MKIPFLSRLMEIKEEQLQIEQIQIYRLEKISLQLSEIFMLILEGRKKFLTKLHGGKKWKVKQWKE